jgi:ATP-dependent RNA helicase DeaD
MQCWAKGPKPAFKPSQKPARVRKGDTGQSKGDRAQQDRDQRKAKEGQTMQAATFEDSSAKPDGSKPQRATKPARQTTTGQPKAGVKSGSRPGATNVSRRFEKPRSPMQRGAKHGGKASGKSGDKTSGNSSGKPNEAKRGGASGKLKGVKNLAPAVGKPNSKKNKARRAAENAGRQAPRRSRS